jgi:hypothetical protein
VLVFCVILSSNSKRPPQGPCSEHIYSVAEKYLLGERAQQMQVLGGCGSEREYNYSLIIIENESEASSSSPCHFMIFLSIKILI